MAQISFARGIPAPECLAVDDLAECARAALQRDGRTILSYGPSPGYGPLRDRLAARHGVDPARIFLTNGSLQGFVFVAQRLAPGKRVLVEQPTYDRPLKILRELGADVVPLQTDDEGLDPDALEAALSHGDLHHARPPWPGDRARVHRARALRAEPRAGGRPAADAPRRHACGAGRAPAQRAHLKAGGRLLPLARARRRGRRRTAAAGGAERRHVRAWHRLRRRLEHAAS